MTSDAGWLSSFLDLCEWPAFEHGDCLFVGDRSHAEADWRANPPDPTRSEAEFNLILLPILWADQADVPPIETLRRMGRVVITSWAASVQPLLRGREVLFSLAGTETVAIPPPACDWKLTTAVDGLRRGGCSIRMS